MTTEQVQALLYFLGYYKGALDGVWGNGSRKALSDFQAAYGLHVDSIFGAESEAALRGAIAGDYTTVTDNQLTVWQYLIDKIGNPYGVSGLMGNLRCESNLQPDNLQDSYNMSLGLSDRAYTQAVDSGKYTNFISDAAGYGLAQWTCHTRKKALLAYAGQTGRSIGSLQMQLDFMVGELEAMGIMARLKAAQSVRAASDLVMVQYEAPADQSEKAKATRAAYGQSVYDKYADKAATPPEKPAEAPDSGDWWDGVQYFRREEFRCKCGGRYCNGYPAEMQKGAVMLADAARKHFGRPANVISGLRCPTHNKNEGGVANSQHMYGEAIDLQIPGVSAADLCAWVKSQPGCRYAYCINGTNVHFDIPAGKR